MQTSLRRIAFKAQKERKHRFSNLYTMLNESALLETWSSINKRAAPGIDRTDAKEYEEKLTEHVADLAGRLREKRYRAKPIKRVYIPKANGKQRPLGLPVIEDKLLQATVSRILSAIYEQDFLDNSYGYRPNRGAKIAAHELGVSLYCGKLNYVACPATIKTPCRRQL